MPPSEKREKLLAAYSAFAAAVQAESPDLESAGDDLADVYTVCIQ